MNERRRGSRHVLAEITPPRAVVVRGVVTTVAHHGSLATCLAKSSPARPLAATSCPRTIAASSGTINGQTRATGRAGV